MHDHDRPVVMSFPEHRLLLCSLIGIDEEFAELCADFDSVDTAHRFWSICEGTDAEDRADEYHGLRLEIEAEIQERLRANRRRD